MTRATILILALATACGGGGGGAIDDAAGSDDAAEIDAPAGDGHIDATAGPITAPLEQWTWVPIDGMACGNGAATGVGVNLTTRSDRLLIFLNGGGACWDAQTCFVLRSAAHVETGYGAAEFAAVSASLAGYRLFSRDGSNPFADASFVFVPYCTGDVHSGHHVATYATAGGPRELHHVGQLNLAALWPRLAATRPGADLVWLAGASAGGYGVMLQQSRARAAFAGATVHALSDASNPVDTEATRWAAMKAAWSLDVPAGCADCADGFGGWPAHLRATMPAGSRWGLLMTTQDQVISQYMAMTGPQLEAASLAVRDAMTAGSGQAAFVIAGTQHVLTTAAPPPVTTGGVTLGDWIRDFAVGAAGWRSVGP